MIKHARNDLELAEQMQDAHKHSSNNKREVLESVICGCFYCLLDFNPAEIFDWTDGDSAICPYCGVDCIIGSSSGYVINEHFLSKMNDYWFSAKQPSSK
jgi:hypothetical protein